MNPEWLETISRELRAYGLSRRYVQRLIGELADHRASSMERHLRAGLSPTEATRMAEMELGDVDAVVAEVVSRPGLLPVARRRPVLTFVSGPIVSAGLAIGLFCVFECVLFLGATRLLGVARNDQLLRTVFLGAYTVFALGLTPVLAAGFCGAAGWFRCSAAWSLCACALLSVLGGSVKAWLVLCPASGSVFFYGRPGLDLFRFAAPLFVFFLFFLVRRRYLWRRRTA